MVSEWWYNTLFLYTSATVLIAARLSPSILTEVCEDSVLMQWQRALEVLGDYNTFGPPVRHLMKTLRALFNTIPQQLSGRSRRLQQESSSLANDEIHVLQYQQR